MNIFILLILLYIFTKKNVKEYFSYVVDETGQDITTTKYVDQGVASVSNGELYTDSVGTCSVIAFHNNKMNFLSHVDALTSEDYLVNTIKKHFNLNNYFTIYVWSGSWCEDCDSQNLIENALDKLNIKNKMKYMGKVNFKNKIIIDKFGKVTKN